jgi:hypothetical protein
MFLQLSPCMLSSVVEMRLERSLCVSFGLVSFGHVTNGTRFPPTSLPFASNSLLLPIVLTLAVGFIGLDSPQW